MEEGIKYINDENNEIYDEEKEAECLYDTSYDSWWANGGLDRKSVV